LQSFWTFVTDFGDSAVTLPLAALALVFLLISGWNRAACALLISVATAGLGIGLLKLALESCGRPRIGASLVNPSGHMAVSVAVYGALALILVRRRPGWRVVSIWSAATALLAAIAVSRIVLHAHTPAEVVAGALVGLLAGLLFRKILGQDPSPVLHFRWFALAAAAVVFAMHGTRWPIEHLVKAIVLLVRRSVPACR
jgi:membrane-associated phospholipid phosphatase